TFTRHRPARARTNARASRAPLPPLVVTKGKSSRPPQRQRPPKRRATCPVQPRFEPPRRPLPARTRRWSGARCRRKTVSCKRRSPEGGRALVFLTELLPRSPASPLAQNAQVERFRALARSGAAAPAAAEARRYLNAHPNGMASDEARSLASAPISAEPGHAS